MKQVLILLTFLALCKGQTGVRKHGATVAKWIRNGLLPESCYQHLDSECRFDPFFWDFAPIFIDLNIFHLFQFAQFSSILKVEC